MVFSSHIFVYYFLPLALASYYALYRAPQRARNLLLALQGYAFYGFSEPRFLLLMFATTLVDWYLSRVIEADTWAVWRSRHQPNVALAEGGARSRLQRTAITASVVSNLAVLGFFKYFNFGVDSYNALVASLGLTQLQWGTALRVLLPLGISFYTFQSLSYIIDVYRGHARAMRNFVDFACFVSMFPHLVAGPILKFSFLAEQLESRTLTLHKFARGVAFFSLGMAKKILLANPCGEVADLVFNSYSRYPGEAWYGLVAYSFQIYFDFSGYSDMAIGLGLMLGFVFARNFDHPYRAESVTDFWRRWHISLSTWLREYLYIPLGGNRKGPTRTYVNLLLTMLLGGLWHGASWTFVTWGALHGLMLAAERAWGASGPYPRLPRGVRVAATFLVVMLGWVFFRAASLEEAARYLAALCGLAHQYPATGLLAGVVYRPFYVVTMLAAAFVVWRCRDTWEFTQRLTPLKAAACVVLLCLSLVVLAMQSYNPFIYFVF